MNVSEKISACLLRVRAGMPFFGALALFAEHRLDEEIKTAATDGRTVLFNPAFANRLKPEELDAVMVHELLHAALMHTSRRGDRNPVIWNYAADIVVNGIVRKEPGLKLPEGPVIDTALEHHEVEEVYEILLSRSTVLPGGGLLEGDLILIAKEGSLDEGTLAELQAHWRNALREATILQRSLKQGKIPAGLLRHLDAVLEPQLDWRSMLWRFLVRTPVDFGDFDRRFIGRGLYLEGLTGETLQVRIAVDTSGSINGDELGQFISELREILRLYPHIEAQLYYADSALYGPHDVDEAAFKLVKGGGGTSFIPFFEKMEEFNEVQPALLIYLTDGHGKFPAHPPDAPVLWVVAPGGLASERFPFGEVARLR